MVAPNSFQVFQSIIPTQEWGQIRKVSLKFKDVLFLKWISLNNKSIYRRYFLKVTYKDQYIKNISISKDTKDQVKQKVKAFNQFLKQETV